MARKSGAGEDDDDRGEAESFEIVTGVPPYEDQEEALLDQERGEARAEDARDHEAPEEVVADPVARDQADAEGAEDDVDRQGRRGQEERDWWGDMYADSGRGRPTELGKRRR
jgi:hypothetical protein